MTETVHLNLRSTSRLIVAVFGAGLVAVACGSSSEPATPAPSTTASTLQAVVFSANFTALTVAGATAQMIATGIMTNLSTRDVTATCTNWQSDNPLVVTVSSSGM